MKYILNLEPRMYCIVHKHIFANKSEDQMNLNKKKMGKKFHKTLSLLYFKKKVFSRVQKLKIQSKIYKSKW